MPPKNKSSTGKYVPRWLRTEKNSFPDGSSKPAFSNLAKLHDLYVVGTVLGAVVATIIVGTVFPRIDQHLCPIQIPCRSPCLVNADADIAGIGVRYAIYIQSFCTIILLGLSPKEIEMQAVRATLVITTIGITATAAIFALQGNLSLPHAMVVVSLLSQILFPNHLIEPWIVSSPGLYVSQQIRLFVYTTLSWWLALKTPCLGSTSECNLCTASFSWFFKGKATGHLRRSGIVFTGVFVVLIWLNQVFWFLGPMNYLRSYVAVFSEERRENRIKLLEEMRRDLQSFRASKSGMPWIWKLILWYEDDRTLYEGLKARRWNSASNKPRDRRKLKVFFRDIGLATKTPRVQRALIAFIIAAICTYDTEKVVQLNLDNNANEWGYGQISAMILCGPSVAGILKLFVSAWSAEKKAIKRAYTL